MRIVFADMSIEQMRRYLAVLGVAGHSDARVLDCDFGYTTLEMLIHCLTFDNDESVIYLVNNPAVIDLVYDEIKGEEFDNAKVVFSDVVYLLTNDGTLISFKNVWKDWTKEIDSGFVRRLLDELNKGDTDERLNIG